MRNRCFRVRSLMIAVAGIAIALGLGLRSVKLLERAKEHHRSELVHSAVAALGGRCGIGDDLDELLTFELTPAGALIRPKSPDAERALKLRAAQIAVRKREHEELSAYHARCARQLEHAAWRPWLSVFLAAPPIDPTHEQPDTLTGPAEVAAHRRSGFSLTPE
jgi:hypothetical protein